MSNIKTNIDVINQYNQLIFNYNLNIISQWELREQINNLFKRFCVINKKDNLHQHEHRVERFVSFLNRHTENYKIKLSFDVKFGQIHSTVKSSTKYPVSIILLEPENPYDSVEHWYQNAP